MTCNATGQWAVIVWTDGKFEGAEEGLRGGNGAEGVRDRVEERRRQAYRSGSLEVAQPVCLRTQADSLRYK